jgi:hypothetical protein
MRIDKDFIMNKPSANSVSLCKYSFIVNPEGLNLIDELTKQPNPNRIYFPKGDISIRLERRQTS